MAALLALAASLSWGSSNFLAGLESRRRSVWTVTAVSQVVAALGAGVALLIVRQPSPDLWHTIGPILGGVASAVGLLAFYRALAIGPMSVVAPIIATDAVVPVAVGLLTGERPGAPAYLGMVLAVGGVALVSWSKGRDSDHATRFAILLAAVTAVLFGILLVGLSYGGRDSPYWAVFDARLASACVIVAYLAASRRGFDLTVRTVPVLACVGLLLTGANLLFTVATTIGYLSVVSILGSLGPGVTTAFAQTMLGERLAVRQWAGFATVFAGVVLLTV
ncbi:MAG TPA: DMT family transporter [Thermoleophilia bacterium]|nr:DMT family transporter [Thermoleophilia bacterium]